MKAPEFHSVVALMQERGIIRHGHGWKADLSKLTDWSRPRIDRYEAEGTPDKTTDLALSALLAGLGPCPQ